MGQIKFTISLVLIALFSFALVSFAINFAVDNDANVSIDDESRYDSMRNNLESDVEVFYTESNLSVEAIGKTTISSQTEATEGGTAFKVGPWTAVLMSKRALESAYRNIFGTDSGFNVFLTTFIALISTFMGFYIYKTLAGRNSD